MNERHARSAWIIGSLLALGVAVAWLYSFVGLEPEQQRILSETSTAHGLNACIVLGIIGAVALVPRLRAWLTLRHLCTGLALGAAAWVLCGIAPRTHRIFFDEQIYMQVGQSYAHTGRLAAASYARAEHGKFEYYSGELNKQPQGWPYLYGQAARWFGVSPRLGQELNRLVVALTACLLYFALTLLPWRLPAGAPIAASLAWSLTPLVPYWGRTAAVEPSTAMTTVAAFFAAVIYIRTRESGPRGRPAAGALLAAATAFAAYFRPESLLVFPLVAVVLWAEEDDFVHDIVAWGTLAFALALVMPNLAQLWAVRGEDWGATDGERFKLSLLGQNLQANGGYFFLGRDFPLIATAFALIGLGWLLARARPLLLVWLTWFIPAWGVFILYYAGGYYYGASNRFAIVSAAPVALVVGVGAAALLATVRNRPAWLGLVIGLGGLSLARAMNFVPALGREAIEVQEEVNFVAQQVRTLPSGSLIISQAPSMWLIEGRNAASWPNVEDLVQGQLNELANQYPGGVYLHYGFWENAEADRADVAARTIIELGAQEVARFNTHAMTFAIYRLDTPTGLSRFGGPLSPSPSKREGELENALRRVNAAQIPTTDAGDHAGASGASDVAPAADSAAKGPPASP